ncbi:LamG domain-containing protein [Candidatus Poribacteria bacterium]|jgi:hypothetical protein|nr:LamG domain-containing protein [Candidatus Poribacteria bacterium]MBT5534544.1 LamG domain-containing protein [Candidatus Poribacteria bacterium]MBT7098228.1 LamG domain-containing protein [Candidatus Poribacteria bacterium]MBT7805700.1 LamG domain-containing protein [Candidatus Poribacteria bacterium]
MARFRPLYPGLVGLLLLAVAWTARAGLDDDSLVAYLSFDEDGGAVAADASQYGHDGELIAGPSWVAGQSGSALEFDATQGQYVQIPVTDTLQLTTAFTAAFWVQRSDDQLADWNYMVGAGTLKWATIYNSNQSVYVWSTAGGAWAQRAMTGDPLTTDWTHLAVTYDVAEAVTVYFDAEPVFEAADPPEADAIDGSIMIGARHPGQEFFAGTIDEVFLFSRAIAAAEIESIMEGEFLAVDPGGKVATTWAAVKARR